MAAPREVGSETQVAGRQLRPGRERDMALDFLRQLGASAGRHAPVTGSDGARFGSPMAAPAGSMGLPAGGVGRPAGGSMGLAASSALDRPGHRGRRPAPAELRHLGSAGPPR